MTTTAVGAVVPLGVNAVALAHTRAQLASDGLYNNMKVVVHQAVGVAEPVMASTQVAQKIKPVVPVSIAKKDGFAPVTTRGDVVRLGGEFDSRHVVPR